MAAGSETAGPETAVPPDRITCGCCGRSRPAGQVHELGASPGVHICARCAWWAAGRMSGLPLLRLDPRRLLRRLRPGGPGDRAAGAVLAVIPVLTSTDLDRTAGYYQLLGFEIVDRHDPYLVLHSGGVELHCSLGAGAAAPGVAFVHVADAGRLWKRLTSEGVEGLGPVQDRPWGLREFEATDPDGNRIRIGSPLGDG